ncbi:carboxy terminal-processing peptidase [Flavobacterium sp. WC2409]|uniref:Carboxy terminal-processing peptidase n=1 Tax=Flavobacterium sp. WC2409 TaxID=3234139 RepID=A0AB39VXZ3_9FLAO
MNKILIVFFLFPFLALAQNEVKTCEILSKINTLIQNKHIQPKPVDDSLSVFVFDTFIDNLDNSRNVFLKSEYDLLAKKYRLNIDDFIKNKNCSFLTDIISVYKGDLLRNQSILEKMKLENIDYEQKDTIRFYKKIFPIYMQQIDVEKVLKKKVRYEILEDIAAANENRDSLNLHFTSLEKETKNRIIENELCKINAILQNEINYQEALFTIFCSYFDPHTAYFSNDSKSSFVASLSKEHLSLGMNVNLNKRNEIIVQDLDANGPAFKTGKIKKGDQIVSISNLKDTLQVSCATLESISNMILSDSNKQIMLTLRRNSGKSFDVVVEKQLIKDEGNSVYSFVIENNNKKYGYVKIPSFYGDLEGNNGKGCAEDTAMEVLKLQKDNIKGLIIDLTDNGGGSMEEAIKLAGMFIDSGPISIVVNNNQDRTVINDPYKGMIYKEPIVVLINGNSASASEFFSSILQDYNRAILVGSTSVGKATMQSIFPLENNDDENFVKITINKFYRINGKSHQGIGVIPNIKLPAIYETITQKESNSPTALKNDSIASTIYFLPYMSTKAVSKIVENSKNRIAVNPTLNEVIQINKKIEELLEKPKSAVPITIDAIFKEQTIISQLWELINSFETRNNGLNIYNSNINNFLLTLYPNENENNKFQLENLKTNHYLNEAISILDDANSLKRN